MRKWNNEQFRISDKQKKRMYILLSENLQYFLSVMSTHKQNGHHREKTRPDKHTRNSPIQNPYKGIEIHVLYL